MTNYKLHNDCKVLSGYVYKDNKPEKMNDWKYSKTWYDSNGFHSEVYKKGEFLTEPIPEILYIDEVLKNFNGEMGEIRPLVEWLDIK